MIIVSYGGGASAFPPIKYQGNILDLIANMCTL